MRFRTHQELKDDLESQILYCPHCGTNSENDLIIIDFKESENEGGEAFCHNCKTYIFILE